MWLNDSRYQYGIFIALLSLWLIVRQRLNVRHLKPTPSFLRSFVLFSAYSFWRWAYWGIRTLFNTLSDTHGYFSFFDFYRPTDSSPSLVSTVSPPLHGSVWGMACSSFAIGNS
jgi:hypothetical protein